MDGSNSAALSVNGSTTFTDLSEGNHQVELSDVADNCSVGGGNPKTVSVPAGGTASATFSVECQARTGDLQVSASTSGSEQDSDGYTVSLDGSVTDSIAPNDTTTIADLSTGDHDVELGDVKSNCSVQGDNPRTVSVAFDSTSTAAFSIECQATTGDIEVSVSTAGDTTDPDGYEITVDGGSATSVGPNGTTTFTDLSEGSHDVELSGIQANCAPGGNNPRSVSVTAGQTTTISYSVDCEPALFNRIAFRSGRGGSVTLWAMNTDGSSPTQLTTDHADMPEVSPDGTRLAFTSSRAGGDLELYVMGIDGSDLTRVTNNSSTDVAPAWSPDGTRLLYASDQEGDFNIYAVDPDGGNLTQLTSDPAIDFRPVWNEDGSQTLFMSTRDGDAEIYRINPDGTGLEQVTDNNVTDDYPSVAPDGSKIVFVQSGGSGGTDQEIFTMNPDGTGVAQLTDNSSDDFWPRYSPDGAWIAFTSERDGNQEVYRMDAGGGNLINLTANGAIDGLPAWSPLR